ncbi:type II toxin-antitoxin system VapC family toxin [Rhizobiaceae bacterium n13]|uniref:Ribonuclease VapC n=1 Tax=Ferirhizobium litorale TaxID=2927786 RepID=A0AAE3QD69_9HYPH|nr:type II toxin-antitoxin system VapC family toxin [Fererhizobium litorale]MDI7861054.1 type II toxin-antitoxin system VapC family toxin [Fererhizobium litorale]MDI7921201.1 type II toxin-antitoxin system VapC family toxin [Fererhizobium litorale]
MASFIVDASVVAVWFLPDEEHEVAEAAMDLLIRQQATAPDLLPHEIRSVLLVAEKRNRIEGDDVLTALIRLKQLPIRIVAGGDDALIVRLARKHNLSAYDAAYLALASTEGLPLATLDRKLQQAAKSEGVPPFSV